MLAFIFNRYIEVSALVWLWMPKKGKKGTDIFIGDFS